MTLNKKIIIVLSVILFLFLSLSVYLTYFGVMEAPKLEKSVYNQRLYQKEEKIKRGTIYDRSGTVLAESKMTDEGQKRVYPYGKIYTHVIGYTSKTYGKSKIELEYNDYLTGSNEIGQAMNLATTLSGKEKSGFDMTLTIDNKLQQYAYDIMGGKNGSIIVMDNKTGAIRAMASNPTFDPSAESLLKNWEELAESDDAPFVARAISGLYAPGSTWKMITASAAIEAGLSDKEYDDEGKAVIGGREYENSGGKAYGKVDLKGAFLHSSNVVFAEIGTEMGKDALSIYERFLLGDDIKFDIPLSVSTLSDKIYAMSTADVASTSIGQGRLMVTPLYMTMVGSVFANGGTMVKPYLVESIDKGNVNAYKAKRKVLAEPVSAYVAGEVKDMMAACVGEGTGGQANVSGLKVYGKTGTAQNETEKSHDWFVGFAENDEGESVTVCVMFEYNGQGSSVSARCAGKIFSYWLK